MKARCSEIHSGTFLFCEVARTTGAHNEEGADVEGQVCGHVQNRQHWRAVAVGAQEHLRACAMKESRSEARLGQGQRGVQDRQHWRATAVSGQGPFLCLHHANACESGVDEPLGFKIGSSGMLFPSVLRNTIQLQVHKVECGRQDLSREHASTLCCHSPLDCPRADFMRTSWRTWGRQGRSGCNQVHSDSRQSLTS